MFNNDDAKRSRSQKLDNNQKVDEFDHIIRLNRGEAIKFGTEAELVYVGTDFIWGEQARFALQAPDDISILRLELFARRFQYYNEELTVNFGDKLSIGPDLQLCLLPQHKDKGQVYVGVHSRDNKFVTKSFFNHVANDDEDEG